MQILAQKGDTTEEIWNGCQQALAETANEVLGPQEPNGRSPWFDDECRAATDAKNMAYRNKISKRGTRGATEEYKVKRREEKKVHKRKKKLWINRELELIETHRNINENRAFYQKVNKGRATFKARVTTIKKEDGTLLSRKEDILQRWSRYFENLLSDDIRGEMEGARLNHIEESEMRDGDEIEPPDFDEMMDAIIKMKNNKAPGMDGIPAELLKHGGAEFHKVLHNLIISIWVNECMPQQWRKAIICPIHKKGDQLLCSNYRGISLLPCAYKVLSNILFTRLTPFAEAVLGKYQAGFRRNKSTVDQIFSLRLILEKGIEFQVPTHHLFIDFKSAYDNVLRSRLYEAMKGLNIPSKLTRLVEMTMRETSSLIRIQSDLSPEFRTDKGLRQGDALACLLFNLALEKVVRDSGIQTSGTIFTKSVQLLAYADDVDIVSRSLPALKDAFLALQETASTMGLIINEEKTKYVFVGSGTVPQGDKLQIGTSSFQRVHEFTYLGSQINSFNNISREISRRIVAANRSYFGLNKYMKNSLISKATKIRLYKTLIRPVLTYASQAWTISKTDEKNLLVFERKILRRIFGAVKDGDEWRRRTNQEVYDLYNEANIVRVIRLSRLSWAGHVVRMEEGEIPRKIMDGELGSRRKVGRPKLRWLDGVSNDARNILGVRNWMAAAKHRNNWNRLIEEARTRQGL